MVGNKIRLWTCFERFAPEKESNDYEETYYLCFLHGWEGYWLLETAMTPLRTNWWAFEHLIFFGYGHNHFVRFSPKKTIKLFNSFLDKRKKVIGYTWDCQTSIRNNIVGVQKLAFLRIWPCVARFSPENKINDNDETFFLFNTCMRWL